MVPKQEAFVATLKSKIYQNKNEYAEENKHRQSRIYPFNSQDHWPWKLLVAAGSRRSDGCRCGSVVDPIPA